MVTGIFGSVSLTVCRVPLRLVYGGSLCHTELVSSMSALSLSERLAPRGRRSALVGHPVVVGLVVAVEVLENELVSLREKNAELRRQLARHSGNCHQQTLQNGPAAPTRPCSQRRS